MKKLYITITIFALSAVLGFSLYHNKIYPFGQGYFAALKMSQEKNGALQPYENNQNIVDIAVEEKRRESGYDVGTSLYTLKVFDFWKGIRSKEPWYPGSKYEHIAILDENEDIIDLLGINLNGELFLNQINLTSKTFSEKLLLKINQLKRPYDILVTHDKKIFVSYSVQKETEIKMVVDEISLDSNSKLPKKTIFQTPFIQFPEHITPSISMGGKLIEFNDSNLLIAIGDINLYNDIAMSDKPIDINEKIGSTFLIDLKSLQSKKFTTGHRNPEGLAYNNSKDKIYLTEHGPQGGDEINILTEGNDYGWPFVSYGSNYTEDTYTKRSKYSGVHERNGYTKPIFSFTPSIGIKSIEQFPYNQKEFPKWANNFLACSRLGIYRLVVDEPNSKLIFLEKLGAYKSYGLDEEKDLLHGCRDIAITSKGIIIANNLSLIFNADKLKN